MDNIQGRMSDWVSGNLLYMKIKKNIYHNLFIDCILCLVKSKHLKRRLGAVCLYLSYHTFFDLELLSLYTLQRPMCILAEVPDNLRARCVLGSSGPKGDKNPSIKKKIRIVIEY